MQEFFDQLWQAVALAVGLAFGLGSREIAGREVESLLSKLRAEGDEK